MWVGRCEGIAMKRRLFTILSALSVLLFVAAVVMWVRSYFVGDVLRHLDATTWTDCASSSGWFYVTVGDAGSSGSRYAGPRWLWQSTTPAEVAGDRAVKRGLAVQGLRFAGFEWIRASYGERFVTLRDPVLVPGPRRARGGHAATLESSKDEARPLPRLRLRPPRDAGAVPGVWHHQHRAAAGDST
jgi:hypothetical protein